jgi:hypothetical protein
MLGRGSSGSFRASIISGAELARSDLEERESRREKKASDSRDVDEKRVKCTVAAAPPVWFFRVAPPH